MAAQTLFILPLAVMPGAVRRLTWLGSDLCDYNGPLLAKAFASQLSGPSVSGAVARDLPAAAGRPAHRHDLVELTKMPERVGEQANPLLALAAGLNPSNAYVADLFGTWNEFYETKRSSATRRRDRTKLKRLGEIGEVRFVTPQDRGEIERTIDVLMRAEGARRSRAWASPTCSRGRAGANSSPRSPPTSACAVSSMSAGSMSGSIWSAINLGLMFRDTYYHVLASYDDGETSRFGPGAAHLRDLLRYSIERGLKHFDFTIGDERYKREWSDHTIMLYDHVAAASVRGWAARRRWCTATAASSGSSSRTRRSGRCSAAHAPRSA